MTVAPPRSTRPVADSAPPLGLLRLVYTSQATPPPGPLELEAMVDASRRANHAAGVSGLLVYYHGHYLQCLEGTPDAVHATFERIRRDPRHRALEVRSWESIGTRAFGSWYMAYAAVGGSTWSMLDGVDWAEPAPASPGLSRGFELLDRVWDMYRNTRRADRGPPD